MSREDREPDELFEIRTNFYIGNYQQTINEATKLKVCLAMVQSYYCVNLNIYYAGAPAGGIWKSTDSGNTWTPLSDNLPQIGVSGIAIDPTNTEIIYMVHV